MMKRYLMAAALAVALAGCSHTKLDPAVEGSATPTVTDASTGGASGQGVGQGAVTPVQPATAAGADAQGPAGAGRVILFDFDRYEVKPEYQSVVEQNARFLQAHPERNVTLEGNTDERGSREYNLALGQKRAEAVRSALTLMGASDKQIEAVSFGAEKPAALGTTEADYAKNRRVDFRYH